MSILQANGAGLGGAGDPGGALGSFYSTTIDQSLRFNDNDSAYLNRTFASAGNQQIWTWSGWVKRGNLASGSAGRNTIFSGSGTQIFGFMNPTTNATADNFGCYLTDSEDDRFMTNRVFRDVNSWYHLVVTFNSTASSNDDRFRLWVNGVQETSWSRFDTITQNRTTGINAAAVHAIGVQANASSQFFDGYMAEVNFIDGTALDATSFGETKNGVWVPKAYSGSYGTNGFYLSFADSAAIGDDLSGNTNDFTATNLAASDVVSDSPTNNFATWNVLQPTGAAQGVMTLSEGNMKATGGSSIYRQVMGNMSVLSGKWYTEFYITDAGYPSWQVGWTKATRYEAFTGAGNQSTDLANFGYFTGSSVYISTFGQASTGTTYAYSGLWSGARAPTTGDVIGCAADFDNGKLWWSINGEWINIGAGAGDPANGTNPSATYTASDYADDFKLPHYLNYNGSAVLNSGQDSTFAGNTTAGGNADGNGYGDFAYAPPSGFLALCSANLPDPAIGPQLASGKQSDDYFETILYTGTGAVQHVGSGGAQHPIDVTTISNSIRFNDAATHFSNTFGSGDSTTTFTISLWFKRSGLSANMVMIGAESSSGRDDFLRFESSNRLAFYRDEGTDYVSPSRLFTDTSRWYHVVVAVDQTQTTTSDKVKIYIDGVQETDFTVAGYPASAYGGFGNAKKLTIGSRPSQISTESFDGYLAEINYIDGSQLGPENFGQTGSNGYWIPKAISGLTYGTSGFRIDGTNTVSSGTTISSFDDQANSNNFDESVTGVDTTDVMGDSPTQNFNTFDPNNCYSSGSRLSEGNLKYTHDSVNGHHTTTLSFNSSGNWYWEVGLTNSTSAWMGIVDANQSCTGSGSINGYFWYPANGYISTNPYGTTSAWSTTALAGDIIGFQINNGVMTIYKNGVSLGNPFTIPTNGYYRPFIMSPGAASGTTTFNFGADDSFAGSETPSSGAQAADANGYGSFYYTPPTGALAIVDDNIPVEGLTGPDFIWWKNRTDAASHMLGDSVRGAGKVLSSNNTAAELDSTSTYFSSFDYDGFTVGNANVTNGAGDAMVAWTWKAGGKANTFNIDGTGYASIAASPISDGSIALTGLSSNTTSGFSIVGYTGTGSNGTIAHGLTSAPEMFICRNRTNARDWLVYHKDIGYTKDIFLNLTNAERSNDVYQQQAPDNSLIYLETQDRINESGSNHIMWCFHSVDGFSKVGSYVGNGSTDGTFVYTGFKPAFVLTKESSSTSGWNLRDNKRSPENVVNEALQADTTGAELTSGYDVDFLSNGFKLRTSLSDSNTSGQTYIYLAFAEQPFKYANAR